MELDEHKIQLLEEAKKGIEQLNEVGQVCLLYNKGADAEACMERIKKIISGDKTNGME